MATVAKASAFLFESLGICSSFQAKKLPNHCLTRLAYLTMCWSCISYSSFTCPTTSLELLRMMSFSDDTDFARSTPTRIASYSVSLLDVFYSFPNRGFKLQSDSNFCLARSVVYIEDPPASITLVYIQLG